MRPYQVTVLTAKGSSSYIALASNSIAAVSDALGIYPDARGISAKPVKTSILG